MRRPIALRWNCILGFGRVVSLLLRLVAWELAFHEVAETAHDAGEM